MKSRKGISPVVAVVLLIAVAVTVGMMVTTWITHWVTEQTDKPSLTCAINTIYVIDSARFNYTGNDALLIKITNEGSEGLYGFGLILDNGTIIRQINSSHPNITISPSVSETNKLTQEHSAYITLQNLSFFNLSAPSWGPNFGKTLTEVKVTNDACTARTAKTTTIATYPS